jgi:hypothetical protein
MKYLKQICETLAKTPEKHLKTIANIRLQHADEALTNICMNT